MGGRNRFWHTAGECVHEECHTQGPGTHNTALMVSRDDGTPPPPPCHHLCPPAPSSNHGVIRLGRFDLELGRRAAHGNRQRARGIVVEPLGLGHARADRPTGPDPLRKIPMLLGLAPAYSSRPQNSVTRLQPFSGDNVAEAGKNAVDGPRRRSGIGVARGRKDGLGSLEAYYAAPGEAITRTQQACRFRSWLPHRVCSVSHRPAQLLWELARGQR